MSQFSREKFPSIFFIPRIRLWFFQIMLFYCFLLLFSTSFPRNDVPRFSRFLLVSPCRESLFTNGKSDEKWLKALSTTKMNNALSGSVFVAHHLNSHWHFEFNLFLGAAEKKTAESKMRMEKLLEKVNFLGFFLYLIISDSTEISWKFLLQISNFFMLLCLIVSLNYAFSGIVINSGSVDEKLLLFYLNYSCGNMKNQIDQSKV